MTQPTTTLTCPKCGADMRSYERNGVTIDQCTGCRGIFLDRGELERLVDAEGAYYGSPPQAARQMPTGRDQRDYGGHDEGHHGGYGDEHGSRGKGQRRRGFLGELFD
jgi:Zn-finger nucleic acid-binding protein